MKKVLSSLMALFFIFGMAVAPVFAETSVQSVNVNVTATVANPNTVTTQIKNIADNANAAAMGFGTINGSQPSWSNMALQYVQISVQDNAPTWNLRAYTNNFEGVSIDTTTWGTDFYGAMLSQTLGGKKIYLNHTVNTAAPVGGVAPVAPMAGGSGTVWKIVQDRNDSGYNPGYINIAVGGPDYTKIFPQDSDGIVLAAPTTPFYWYVEGNFNAVAADSYTAKFKLELVNL